jgi:hypothetical protein
MFARRNRKVIAQLALMTFERIATDLRTAAAERVIHNQSGTIVGLLLIDEIPNVLKPKFIHCARVQNRHVDRLENVQVIGIVESPRRQSESADSLLVQVLRVHVVAHTQRVVLIDSKVEAGRDS